VTRPTVLVLLSGGLDSAVLLAWARGKGRVAALTFEGPDRPRGERRAARRLLDHYAIRRRYVLRLPEPVPSWVRGPTDRGYVPGRNLFHHAGAMLLARRLGCRWVAAGHLAADAAAFPDARRRFLDDLERLANEARRRGEPPVGILTPFLGFTKARVAALGAAWGVPLGLTWSCYRDGPRPCERCVACRERRAALRSAHASARRSA
jgi:7-cyano-7-deazaguanine synthase